MTSTETSQAEQVLVQLIRSGQTKASAVKRLKVIHAYFYQGMKRTDTAGHCGVNLPFVDRWQQRWRESEGQRTAWFGGDAAPRRGPKADRAFILSLVADKPRSGAPAEFGPQVRAAVIALALRHPRQEGLPIERWSHELLAEHVVKKGIAERMSSTRVGDFLKSAPLNPSPG